MTPNEVSMVMLKAIMKNPGDVERFHYRMGSDIFMSLRKNGKNGDVYLTSSGDWYLRGHRIDVDYDDPARPVTIEVCR